jgi:CHAD domain-containing protein
MKIRWDASKTVSESASENLPELARQFFRVGRKLEGKEPSLAALHRFRLFVKRFRYALEWFGPCYGPGLTRRIEALRVLQQHLGNISDCEATQKLVAERDDLRAADRKRLMGYLQKQTCARVKKFRRHWDEEFSAPEREHWWTDYLTRFAIRRR